MLAPDDQRELTVIPSRVLLVSEVTSQMVVSMLGHAISVDHNQRPRGKDKPGDVICKGYDLVPFVPMS